MPKILKVETPEYGKLIVEASDGVRYHADLTVLSHIANFPQDEGVWNRVKIDNYGITLIWPSRLQLHLGQISSRAFKKETLARD